MVNEARKGYLAWLDSDLSTPFRFCDAHRRGLLKLVRSERTVRALELHVYSYARVLKTPARRTPNRTELRRELKALGSSAAKLRGLIAGEESYATDEVLARALLHSGNVIDESDLMLLLDEIVSQSEEFETRSLDESSLPAANRPPDKTIRTLDFHVARSLDDAGVKLTRSRDGKLADVLRIVREATKRPLAEDCFDDVRRAIGAVERLGRAPSAEDVLRRRREL